MKKKGFTGVCFIKMVLFIFLFTWRSFFSILFHSIKANKRIRVLKKNPKLTCSKNQTVPVCFFSILWPMNPFCYMPIPTQFIMFLNMHVLRLPCRLAPIQALLFVVCLYTGFVSSAWLLQFPVSFFIVLFMALKPHIFR